MSLSALDAAPPADSTTRLFDNAIRSFGQGKGRRVMDFGCGAGALVRGLESAGYESYGCDFRGSVGESPSGQLREIGTSPAYALPFPDEYFDVIVSTSVLEHAQNKHECFVEMRRVLKPGGFAVHLFPAKMYPSRTGAGRVARSGGSDSGRCSESGMALSKVCRGELLQRRTANIQPLAFRTGRRRPSSGLRKKYLATARGRRAFICRMPAGAMRDG